METITAGELSPDIQTEWMDIFKADFGDRIIESLETLITRETDPMLVTKIADGILKFDSLNENAISYKCAALCNMGKRGLAKKSYDHFCEKYLEILGESYSKPFRKLFGS